MTTDSENMMPSRPRLRLRPAKTILVVVLLALFCGQATASLGDRLPEFKRCVQVCAQENCSPVSETPTEIPIHRRLLLWTCPQECDYTCQHIVTASRVAAGKRVTQFHGKWPFHRIFGVQEPFSVVFSLGNLWVHWRGLEKIKNGIPNRYTLKKFYVWFAQIGIATWIFSTVFHMRDFNLTEELDYLAAGGSVLYGMYYAPVRIFRLDVPIPRRESVLRLWTTLCICAYVVHVLYLKLVKWDYGYNMTANVVLGVLQNALWSWFSWKQYSKSQRPWTAWPGIAVAWVMMAMSLELLDFPPIWGSLDAHSLWHAGTIFPAILWYSFLVKDAQDDIAGANRIKS
ncbi:hypothetical protein MKZ38_007112 [Zalerion maritima]|uniref:Post-GPI attachment to proteins factor 3 n=1 Tax=Zalerion maritima TaxID=339359 RepID=A0AAD5WNE8_9PEZI|nr:hypothetical protein MKZ38_007112 [Zalerion maritima]